MIMSCVILAGGPAEAQSGRISCPVRVVTKAGAVVPSPQTAGFKAGFDKDNSMAFLMGVDLYPGPAGAVPPLKPSAAQKDRITWTVDGSNYEVGCRYEAGIVLTRAVSATAKSCTAAIKAGLGPKGERWNLETAVVTCR
jgi:hypothetical protein